MKAKAKPAAKTTSPKFVGTEEIRFGTKLKIEVPAKSFEGVSGFKGKGIEQITKLIKGSLKGAKPYVKRGESWQPFATMVEEMAEPAAALPTVSSSSGSAVPEAADKAPATMIEAILSDPAVRLFMVQSALPAVTGVVWQAMKKHFLPISEAMDPRLQVALARSKMGMPRRALSSSSSSELPVIARVSDVNAWEALSEVRVGATIGAAADGGALVTGRIPVARIEAVRQQPFILSLKASQSVRAALAETTREIGVRPALLPGSVAPSGGKGAVVGIVDFGCDFAHRNFRKADGSSRVETLWHQAGVPTPASPLGYGRLFTKAEIDAALTNQNPYTALGYGPRPDTPFERGSHGTHVMDIAAGNGLGSGVPGCAPEADFIFVEVSASDIEWSGPKAVGQSFGDSVQVLEAVKFIFDRAGVRPCVVNLSLGTNGGPHDGSTLVEQGFDSLIRGGPNRAIVIAASNSQADGIHAQGTVPASGSHDLQWQTQGSDTGHEIDIWLPGAARVAVELIAPDGTSLGIAEPGTNLPIGTDQELAVFIANRLNEPNNHDNLIGIFIAGGISGGVWIARLHSRDNAAAPFHAWIERFDRAQSSFVQREDRFTLGSISCGHETIVVGSYDAHKAAMPLSYFSSCGPTRDNRQKPEVSAPGHAVLAAWSRTGNGVIDKSGTSMAAPAVTGLLALLLAEARRRHVDLDSANLRDLLIRSARQNPPGIGAGQWHERYGHGRVSAGVLQLLDGIAPPAAPSAPIAAAARKPAKPTKSVPRSWKKPPTR